MAHGHQNCLIVVMTEVSEGGWVAARGTADVATTVCSGGSLHPHEPHHATRGASLYNHHPLNPKTQPRPRRREGTGGILAVIRGVAWRGGRFVHAGIDPVHAGKHTVACAGRGAAPPEVLRSM
ncbi:hypothetical protein Pmani_032465 [Petrolisthes manimaculis]|uniref:Uncharacterized protein n=1 Tax=Petrolisthes manimaculis TaxID=1843537 RepID=A0AAE1TRF0_9EUCA|nr:hypothetical protein Pmani_032465 [Petrolisthes manimaculis]